MFDDVPREQRLLVCRAVANMIAADREITDDERRHLEELLEIAGLSLDEPDVREAIEAELSAPSQIGEIVEKIEAQPLRALLFRALVEIAAADGTIAPAERAKIIATAELYGLEMDAAKELVDWTVASLELEQREKDILARLLGSSETAPATGN